MLILQGGGVEVFIFPKLVFCPITKSDIGEKKTSSYFELILAIFFIKLTFNLVSSKICCQCLTQPLDSAVCGWDEIIGVSEEKKSLI